MSENSIHEQNRTIAWPTNSWGRTSLTHILNERKTVCGLEVPEGRARHKTGSENCKVCYYKTKGRALHDLRGKRFGWLVAIRYAGNHKWECRCDCGVTCKTTTSRLTCGIQRNCPSCRSKRISSSQIERLKDKEIVGKTYGAWTVESYDTKGKYFC